MLLRSLKVATAKLTSQLYLIWLRPYFHLTIYLGPWSVLSAVSVLTAQLSMSSLNIYHQFMLFRDSLPKVRFTRSPLAKRIKFKNNLCSYFYSNKNKNLKSNYNKLNCWELPCCTSINLCLFCLKAKIDVILKYVS